jgi:MFS family permease
LGSGITFVPSLAVVSEYFKKRQATAISVVFMGLSLGSILTPIMVNNMLQKSNLGFSTAIRIHAGVLTFLLILGCVLIKPRLPPPKTQANLCSCLRKFSREKTYIILLAG